MADFTDHPLIASLLNASGLGGLTSNPTTSPIGALAQPSGNPLVPPSNQIAMGGGAPTIPVQPKVAAPKSAPNQPEYKQARFFDPRQPGAAGNNQGASGLPTEPGSLSPDVQNNPTVMDLLAHFGVHPQQQIDPGLFIHNADAWRNHPVMSGVLDGLLSGLANTQGGDTVGQSVSNVAKGLQTTHDQQIAHVNAQLQMPFQQAMTVAQLQDQVHSQDFKQAEAAKNRAISDYYDALPNIKEAENQTKVQVQNTRNQGLLERQKAHDQVVSKLPDPAKAVYNQSYQTNLSRITSGRDTSVPGQEPTDEEKLEAANKALQDAVVTPAVTKAVSTSHGTVGDKVTVAAAGAANRAANTTPPDVKARYDQINKEYQNATRPGIKASDRAALAHSSQPWLTADDLEWQNYLKDVKGRLDSATDTLRRSTPSPSNPSKPTNPYRQ